MMHPFLRLTLLSTVLALVACAGPEKPQPEPLSTAPAKLGVQLAWKSALGKVDFPLEVRVIGTHVIVAGSDGTVAEIDAETGHDVWRTVLGSGLSAGVGSDGHYTAVVNRENELVVLSAGAEIWRHKLSANVQTAPLVAGARVFVTTGDRTILAFDAARGVQLWQQQQHAADPLVLGQGGLLLAVGNTLVIGVGGHVQGLDPLTGSIRWEAVVASGRGTNEVERLSDVVAGYSRVGDVICVRAYQYNLGCVDARSGQTLWSKSANGTTGISGDDSTLYGTESNGTLVAWQRKDGEKVWSSDALHYRMLSAPVVAGHSLVVGDDDGDLIFLARKDASMLASQNPDGSAIRVTPVLEDQTLVVVTSQGGVFAYRPE